MLSILAIHQFKLFVYKNQTDTINKNILVFFIINAFVSIATYFLIVYKTGAINPFLYQGEYQKYFIQSGMQTEFLPASYFKTFPPLSILEINKT